MTGIIESCARSVPKKAKKNIWQRSLTDFIGIAYYYVKTTSTNCKLYFHVLLARVLFIKLSSGLRKLLHFREGPTTLEKILKSVKAAKRNSTKQVEYCKYYRRQTSLDKFFFRPALRTVGLVFSSEMWSPVRKIPIFKDSFEVMELLFSRKMADRLPKRPKFTVSRFSGIFRRLFTVFMADTGWGQTGPNHPSKELSKRGHFNLE